MESLQQHIEHLGLALKAQFFAHPSWAYLIIILVFIIYLVGIICNKDWAVRPAGHYSGWHMIEDFLGRTGLRILSGLLILNVKDGRTFISKDDIELKMTQGKTAEVDSKGHMINNTH